MSFFETIPHKMLFWGGVCIMATGASVGLTFAFSIGTHLFDHIEMTNQIAFLLGLWIMASALMMYQGNKFIEQGLDDKQSKPEVEHE